MDIVSIRGALGASAISSGIAVIPTGIHTIDDLLGGGVAVGRTVSIVGKGGSGKSTLLYGLLHNVIRMGGFAILIDPEYAYYDKRMHELGYSALSNQILLFNTITVDDLFEQFQTIVDTVVKLPNYKFGVIVIDTFSDLPSKQEMNSGTPGIGIHARFASLFFRNALSKMAQTNMTVIFVCHEKTKISTFPGGGMAGYGYIAQNAIYANAFQEFRMIRTTQIKSGTNSVGFKVKIDVRKNKLAPPFRDVVVDYYYQFGYDRAKNIFDGLILKDLASKNGAWYTLYTGEKFQLGTVRQDVELLNRLENILINGVEQAPQVPEEDVLSATKVLQSFVKYGFATLLDDGSFKIQNGDIITIIQLAGNSELLDQYNNVISQIINKQVESNKEVGDIAESEVVESEVIESEDLSSDSKLEDPVISQEA